MNNLLKYILLGTALMLMSCDPDGAPSIPGSLDVDSDSDGDADSDADSDGDADTESDAGLDNDTDNTNPAELVLPIKRDNGYVLELATSESTLLFECKAAHGGRITRFELEGENILVGPEDGSMYGSTFWTSPQSAWNWPPPNAMDVDDYEVAVNEDAGIITLTSGDIDKLGVRIIKTFTANLTSNAIDITYTVQNTGDSAGRFAPWEITRVAEGGISFYRQGNGAVNGSNQGTMDTAISNGIVWYEHPTDLTGDNKLFDDSEDGWIAHTNGELLLVKTFEQADSVAPAEAEIELYGTNNYVEVEQQGSYVELEAGEELHWKLTWHLLKIPTEITVKTESDSLVQLVDETI